jgi:competence ComEA-like helix-hairpin-helix protein
MKNVPAKNPASASRLIGPAALMAALLAYSAGALRSELRGPAATAGGWGCLAGQSGVAVVRTEIEPGASARACPAGVSYILGLPFDLNAATAADLERLDGIGPASAAAIVAAREDRGGFRDVKELEELKRLQPRGRQELRRFAEVR